MKGKKGLLWLTLSLILLVQLYRPSRTVEKQKPGNMDFMQCYNVPDDIKTTLSLSCYDCHSDRTRYPWYSQFQPIRMLIDRDVEKGRSNLNFDEWGSYSKRKQRNKLSRIEKQLEAGEMPLKSYVLLHPEAELSGTQKRRIIDFLSTMYL
jgi:hypothetical protein